MVCEPQVRTCITRGINGLIAPLDKSLGIGEAAFFFCRGGCRQKEYLRLNRGWIDCVGMWYWSSMPERCRLYLVEIAYHHPIQLFEGLALHRRMSTACRWILSKEQVALDFAVEHGVAGD